MVREIQPPPTTPIGAGLGAGAPDIRTLLENSMSFIQNSTSFISAMFRGNLDNDHIQNSINIFHDAINDIRDTINGLEGDEDKQARALAYVDSMETNFNSYCDELKAIPSGQYDTSSKAAMTFLEKVRDAERNFRSLYDL